VPRLDLELPAARPCHLELAGEQIVPARLERRSPGIAAVLFRNLSRILAGRVAETTQRIR